MRGAVLSGAFDIRPTSRKSRRHYGFSLDHRFDPAIHDRNEVFIDPWSRKEAVKEQMTWELAKVIDKLTTISAHDY